MTNLQYNMETKIRALEYIIDCLIEWYKEQLRNDNYLTSFTKLKVIKLLFFVSAVNATKDNAGLLNIFNRFVAMPFGPVESDIYNQINISNIGKYTVSDKSLSVGEEEQVMLEDGIRVQIDNSIQRLKDINPALVGYTAFELVDLSHKWSCWQVVYNYALQINKGSFPIPNQLIVESDKYYQI